MMQRDHVGRLSAKGAGGDGVINGHGEGVDGRRMTAVATAKHQKAEGAFLTR